MRYFAVIFFCLGLFFTGAETKAQSREVKMEAILTSQKWTCLNVSRKKLEKMDFSFEIGNELSLSIDKKYSFKNNNYDFAHGKWKLDKKTLYFFYSSPEENKTLTTRYKIQRINNSSMRLKRLDRPKGKLDFK